MKNNILFKFMYLKSQMLDGVTFLAKYRRFYSTSPSHFLAYHDSYIIIPYGEVCKMNYENEIMKVLAD